MRCYICNSVINKPVWNGILRSWEPCTVCLEIINNIFEDHPDVSDPEIEEDVEEAIGRYNWTKPLGGVPTVVIKSA